MATRKAGKEVAAKKGHGLSRAEKIAIPIIVIIAVWAGYSLLQPPPTSSSLQVTYSSKVSLTNSAAAPDFALPVVGPNGLTGETLRLSAFQGKIVLLEFMEPWCPHCVNMAPVLEEVVAQYGSANFVMISIAGPWDGATANDAAKFIKDYGTNWIYVYDSSGIVFSNYGVNSTPTFFVIDKNGSVVNTFSGEQSAGVLLGALSEAART